MENRNNSLEDLKPVQTFFSSLPLPFPSTIIRMIFSVIAYVFDIIYQQAYDIVLGCFPKYSEDLDPYAQERGITKIQGESDIQFRKRITYAYQFARFSSTLQGIEDMISTILGGTVSIRELHTEDWILGHERLGENTILGNDVSSYYFVVDLGDRSLTLVEKRYLEQVIEEYKPAHVGFHINAHIVDENVISNNY